MSFCSPWPSSTISAPSSSSPSAIAPGSAGSRLRPVASASGWFGGGSCSAARSVLLYVVAGGLVGLAVDASGIRPTVTGVALGLLTPTRGWVSDRRLRAILDKVLSYPSGDHWSGDTEERKVLSSAGKAAREALSPVERLEATLHPWVAFGIMPLFALANAGIPVSFSVLEDPVAQAVVAGFVLGKPAGVIGFAWLAVRSGLAVRPADLGLGYTGRRRHARRHRLHHGTAHRGPGIPGHAAPDRKDRYSCLVLDVGGRRSRAAGLARR